MTVMSCRPRVLALVGVVLCGALASARQPAPPSFRTATILTELDVLPVGEGGAIVTGLVAADFEVTEDSVPQVVDSVEFIDVDAAPQASLPTGVVSNAYRSTARVWVLVVDDLRLGRSLEAPVRSALTTLVAGLAPPDMVALVPTSGRRDQRVEFTRDKGEIRRAIGRIRFSEAGPGQTRLGTPVGPPGGIDITGTQGTPTVGIGTRPRVGTEPPSPSARSGGTDPMMASPELQAEAADDRLLTTLADVSAMIGPTSASRAMVVLVSSGLPVTIHPEALRTLDQTDFHRGLREPDGRFTRLIPWEPTIQRERRMEQTVRLILEAQRGGVTVYAVNPLHLDRVWSERLTAVVQQEDARQRLRLFDEQANPLTGHPYGFLGALSAATGGVTFTGVLDPEAVARSLLADSGRYYLVRYYPARQSRDTRLRAVEVRVRRAGVTVRSRGRYATLVDREAAAARVLDPLPAVLGEVLPRSDLHLEVLPRLERAGAGGRPSHVRLLVRIVPDGAAWGGGDRYDVRAVAIDEKGRVRSTATGSFEAPSALPDTPRGGHFTLGPLAPGRYQFRLAVHDVMRDRAGSVFLDMTVP